MHGLSFQDTYLVDKDPLKFNKAISSYLINLNIILCHAFHYIFVII